MHWYLLFKMIKYFVFKASKYKWVVENGVGRNLEQEGRIIILHWHFKFAQANVFILVDKPSLVLN